MFESVREIIFQVSVWALPALTAITLHEAAHGYVAERFGDPTARRAGRVTLNPVRHIDPFGTVVLPLLMLAFTPVVFGYAKPVPVNFQRLSPKRLGMALVALAGPAMNIALAILAVLLLRTIVFAPEAAQGWIEQNLVNALVLNVVLALINMLPLLPLDGGRVLHACLPEPLARVFAKSEKAGIVILLSVLVLVPLIATTLGAQISIFSLFLQQSVQYVVSLIVIVVG